jgi:hypothetical protein
MDVQLVWCHVCKQELIPNPVYPETVSKYCPICGDFFIQRLRGQDPELIFRPFESTPNAPPSVKVSAKKRERVLKVVHKPEREPGRVGHPGYIIQCDQTGEIFPSIFRASQVMGVARGSMSKHINGKMKSVRGYTFTKIGDNI